jgi:hypothetical protein
MVGPSRLITAWAAAETHGSATIGAVVGEIAQEGQHGLPELREVVDGYACDNGYRKVAVRGKGYPHLWALCMAIAPLLF